MGGPGHQGETLAGFERFLLRPKAAELISALGDRIVVVLNAAATGATHSSSPARESRWSGWVVTAGATAPLVHFACHAQPSPDNPRDAGLELWGAVRLTVREIAEQRTTAVARDAGSAVSCHAHSSPRAAHTRNQ